MPRRDARSARAKDEDDGATPRRKNLGTSENDEMQRTTRKRRERREKNDEKRTNDCENGCDTCANAAENGHLECLKYAHEHGCPWNEETCSFAAMHGHLECLKYARERGCPWDVWTCRDAAWKGHLECLKYAREHRCPWDKDECIDAALAYGNTACLTYMRTLKDAVESKLDDAMSALDEIARDIPEGAYVTICAALKLSHDEHKKRKR